MFWLKKTNRKLRNDERQNTQRDKHTTRQSARVTHPAQLTQLEHRLQPLTGQDGPVTHCFMCPRKLNWT